MRITGDSTSRRCTTALILRLVHQDRLTELGHPALTMAFALLIFRRIRSTQAFPLLIPPLSDCMLSAHPTLTNMNPMGSGVGLYPRTAAQARLPANRATTGAQAVPSLTPAIAVEHPRKSWLAATHLSAVTLSALARNGRWNDSWNETGTKAEITKYRESIHTRATRYDSPSICPMPNIPCTERKVLRHAP